MRPTAALDVGSVLVLDVREEGQQPELALLVVHCDLGEQDASPALDDDGRRRLLLLQQRAGGATAREACCLCFLGEEGTLDAIRTLVFDARLQRCRPNAATLGT
jgi:hypothetical protein